MHHTVPTIKRYLTQENSTINGHYGAKLGGKLAPFHDDVIELRSKGITYPEIQKYYLKRIHWICGIHPCIYAKRKKSPL